MAESYVRRSRPEEAADYFLRAAEINSENQSFVAESLFRAAEMLESAGDTAGRDEIIRRLQENFPESEWRDKARQLQENA